MRLGTLLTSAGPRLVAVIVDGGVSKHVDLNAVDRTLPGSLRALLELPDGLDRARAAQARAADAGPFVEGRLTAPIPNPGKILCIGLNYRDHAVETGAAIPSEPVCFSKFENTIIGPDDQIVLPAAAKEVDYEAELVAVIGRAAKNVAATEASRYVAGYMCGHDVSARDWQKGRPGGQWLLGKSPDTFAPIGPYFVTADEIADPHRLNVALRLNGKTMQQSNTREFIFGIDQLIAHVSQLITLRPGDLIFTGTPPGVGAARKPPVFLKAGDVVEVEIEGLGTLRNSVVAETARGGAL